MKRKENLKIKRFRDKKVLLIILIAFLLGICLINFQKHKKVVEPESTPELTDYEKIRQEIFKITEKENLTNEDISRINELTNLLAQEHHSPPTAVIEQGSGVEPASYIIFKDDEGIVYAKNGSTGAIDFKSTNASYVIQSAIDALTNGGKIFIKAGTYTLNSQITVNANIAIIGEGYSSVFQWNLTDATDAITTGGDYGVIKGIRIVGNAMTTGSAIKIKHRYWKILNNYFETWTTIADHGAVMVDAATATPAYLLVDGNTFTHVHDGVSYIWSGKEMNYVTVSNNLFVDVQDGIESGSDWTIIGNVLYVDDGSIPGGPEQAIVLGYNRNIVKGNIIIGTSTTRWVDGIQITYAANNIVEGNIIVYATDGIDLTNSANYNNQVFNNQLISCTTAIRRTTGNFIKNNVGFITENSGTATIANNGYIAHGLASTPTKILLTANSTEPRIIQAIFQNSTHFKVGFWNASASPPSPITVAEPIFWYAEV
jgi:parallel beta-helix repeat protein